MATSQRHPIGRRANAMLHVSAFVYYAEGCAVLRRAELRCVMPRLCFIKRCGPSPPWLPSPDRTDVDLKLELPEQM
eukprot:1812216-Pyramimonas_sp.AAC.1